MGAPGVLPDSRLADPKGTVMGDWPLPGGGTVRLELEPIYCFHCGLFAGYTPREVMSFVSYLCQQCADEHGEYAKQWTTSDDAFWKTVAAEMESRYGHVLSQAELEHEAEAGTLGRMLELLERESPYKVWRG